MRFSVMFLFAGAAFAQSPPAETKVQQPNRAVMDAIRSMGASVLPGKQPVQTSSSRRGVVVMQSTPCAVPLIRVPVNPEAFRMPIVVPSASISRMPLVKLPAPPCDER